MGNGPVDGEDGGVATVIAFAALTASFAALSLQFTFENARIRVVAALAVAVE